VNARFRHPLMEEPPGKFKSRWIIANGTLSKILVLKDIKCGDIILFKKDINLKCLHLPKKLEF